MNINYKFKIEELLFIYTLKCNFNCGHCCAQSSIKRTEKMDISMVIKILEDASYFGIRKYRISGGEPLLYINDILKITSHAKKFNMYGEIQTNGFWATNIDKTKKILKELQNNCIKYISVSYDRFHSKYIGFENILNIFEVIKDMKNIKMKVLFTATNLDLEEYSILYKIIKLKLPYVFNRCALTGNALDLSNKLFVKYNDIYRIENFRNERCINVQNPIIYSNYDVFVCCNSCFFDREESKKNFYLGNLRIESFSEIYTKLISSSIYNLLASKGPGKLYKLFEKDLKNIGFKIKNSYNKLGMCELCMDLLSEEKYINIYNKKLN